MKVGILTLPLSINYGGILQAYALQTVLERLGHEPVVINRNILWTVPGWKLPLIHAVRRAGRVLTGKDIDVDKEISHNNAVLSRSRYTAMFVSSHIRTVTVDRYSDLSERMFDAIVVGSDQIWRPKYFYADIRDAYLYFARKWQIRRVAYAASFGTDEWEYTPEQTAACAALAGRFDAVSVREDGAVELCRSRLGVDSVRLLDPTLLLDAEDYVSLLSPADRSRYARLCSASSDQALSGVSSGRGDFRASSISASSVSASSGRLFVHFLDGSPQKHSFAERAGSEWGLSPFSLQQPAEAGSGISSVTTPGVPAGILGEWTPQPPVEDWIGAFLKADAVVTDSFHGCIFSMIFRKPFIVIGNKERGMSRFVSLLSLLGLEDRLVESADGPLPGPDVDFAPAYERLRGLRRESLDFLQKNL